MTDPADQSLLGYSATNCPRRGQLLDGNRSAGRGITRVTLPTGHGLSPAAGAV